MAQDRMDWDCGASGALDRSGPSSRFPVSGAVLIGPSS
jgi:hypothetical protein